MVEHQPSKLRVAGSSPVSRSRTMPGLRPRRLLDEDAGSVSGGVASAGISCIIRPERARGFIVRRGRSGCNGGNFRARGPGRPT